MLICNNQSCVFMGFGWQMRAANGNSLQMRSFAHSHAHQSLRARLRRPNKSYGLRAMPHTHTVPSTYLRVPMLRAMLQIKNFFWKSSTRGCMPAETCPLAWWTQYGSPCAWPISQASGSVACRALSANRSQTIPRYTSPHHSSGGKWHCRMVAMRGKAAKRQRPWKQSAGCRN